MRARGSIRASADGVVSATLAAALLSGCASEAGHYRSLEDSAFRARMCASTRAFVRAPTALDGSRQADFLPFGMSDDWIDVTAPMSAEPLDAFAQAFYDGGPGQLTHYVGAPELGHEFARCLNSSNDFRVLRRTANAECFGAVIVDRQTGRRVMIVSADDATTILIREADSTREPIAILSECAQ